MSDVIHGLCPSQLDQEIPPALTSMLRAVRGLLFPSGAIRFAIALALCLHLCRHNALAISSVLRASNAARNCRSSTFNAARLASPMDVGANKLTNAATSSETNSSICLAEQCRIAAPVTQSRAQYDRRLHPRRNRGSAIGRWIGAPKSVLRLPTPSPN
jgi:hypothetical protein